MGLISVLKGCVEGDIFDVVILSVNTSRLYRNNRKDTRLVGEW